MPINSGHLLEINDLSVRYPSSSEWVLDGLYLSLSSQDRFALVGPSGSGKSTVARVALNMLPQGSICKGGLLIAGNDPRNLNSVELRTLRGSQVGVIFQDPMTRLNPLMTIGTHLLDTLQSHRPNKSFAWRKQKADQLLQKVGINPERFDAYPHEFSGGMRQRIVIALAIALEPLLVIADEPTTSLDVEVANKVMGELTSLCNEIGSALLLITHDLAMAAKWCDQIGILDQGKIVEHGLSNQILMNPYSHTGKKLISAARKKEDFDSYFVFNSPSVLEVNNLRCWHPVSVAPFRVHWIKAVDEMSFSLHKGEILGIVGASGCGKSTLCRALLGLTPIRGGTVKWQGFNISSKKKNHLNISKNIQMVFQDPLACLNPKMRVGEAIADPFFIHNLYTRAEASEKVRHLLDQVGLTPAEKFQNRLPCELSGGQQQRVVIARALALSPKVLICDESLSMLDAEIQVEILNLLLHLKEDLELSILFITHDLLVASSFCNRLIILDKGRIVEEGTGKLLFNQPQAEMTKRLVAACPRFPDQDGN